MRIIKRMTAGIRQPAADHGRHRAWRVLAALLAMGGTAGAAVSAHGVARRDVELSNAVFQQSSAEVASALQLAIRHQDDLVVNASGFVVANSDASEADFRAWASSVHVLDRYPEVLGFGFRAIVSAAELPAFVARIAADPPTVLAPDGSVQISPPGSRPFYCLTKLGQIRSIQVGSPAGVDWCAAPHLGSASLRARDSGRSVYWPVQVGETHLLSVSVPVYRRGIVPTTVAARREAILGWVSTESVPKVMLDHAVQSHPEMSVAFRCHDGTATVGEFLSGTAPHGTRSVTIDLHNGWTVQTFQASDGGGVADNRSALALLIAGTLLSVLIGVLVLVLATGRARAFRLVEERTAQLRGAQAQLVDSARTAGMAEIATNILHNVGNVLNSVNVSADLVRQKLRGSRVGGLSKATALMQEHADDLGAFMTTDAKGRQLLGYLDKLAAALAAERVGIEDELQRLTKGVAHIKEIVNAQQSLAGISAVVEPVQISDLLEDALRMAGALSDDEITVTRNIAAMGPVALDRHRVLLVVLNLIGNAMHATKANTGRPRLVSVRAELMAERSVCITVDDNGEGVPPENLIRMFQHGFTTRVDGHGFGLHSSALAAKSMGGTLTVHSDGASAGAAFTLEVPLQADPPSEDAR